MDCFISTVLRTFFTARIVILYIHKNIQPTLQRGLVICRFNCQWDIDYGNKISQRLEVRIGQHILISIHLYVPITLSGEFADVWIGHWRTFVEYKHIMNHLLRSVPLRWVRTKHHRNILKAAVVNSKRTTLCRQWKLKHKLKIFMESFIWSGVQWIFSLFSPSRYKPVFIKKKITLISNYQQLTSEEVSAERHLCFVFVLNDFKLLSQVYHSFSLGYVQEYIYIYIYIYVCVCVCVCVCAFNNL